MHQSVVTWHMQCVYGCDGLYHVIAYLHFKICSCRLQPESESLVTSQGECITDHECFKRENTVLAFSYFNKRNMVITEIFLVHLQNVNFWSKN